LVIPLGLGFRFCECWCNLLMLNFMLTFSLT
jgi:hypothetical protein